MTATMSVQKDKELTIKNFRVTKVNSNTAYLECVKAGPDSTLDKILEIYREDAAVDAHIHRQHSDSSAVHQVNAEINSSKEGEEDVYKLHGYTQSSKSSTKKRHPEATLDEHVFSVIVLWSFCMNYIHYGLLSMGGCPPGSETE